MSKRSEALIASLIMVLGLVSASPARAAQTSKKKAVVPTIPPLAPKTAGLPRGVPDHETAALDQSFFEGTERALPFLDVTPVPAPIQHGSLECKLSVLSSLGWDIKREPEIRSVETTSVGPVCGFTSPREAMASGRLRVWVPSDLSSAADQGAAEAALDRALRSQASLCSYGLQYATAIQTATQKLQNNWWYSFNSFFHQGSARLQGVEGWQQVGCYDDQENAEARKKRAKERALTNASGVKNKTSSASDDSSDDDDLSQENCFIPYPGQNSVAVHALYTSSFASECASGLHLAEYAAIYELFGEKAFNQRFQPGELFVSNWKNIERSPSVIHGLTGRRYFDKLAQNYAAEGPNLLSGVPGYMGNVFGEKYLDDKPDRGENFIIVKASARAAQSLAANGGLDHYALVARQIWSLTQDSNEVEKKALEENQGSYTKNGALAAQLLNDPFLAETVVYTHGVGFKTLAGHIMRLARLNPRTPYKFYFYAEAAHGEIYDRWIQMKLDECEGRWDQKIAH